VAEHPNAARVWFLPLSLATSLMSCAVDDREIADGEPSADRESVGSGSLQPLVPEAATVTGQAPASSMASSTASVEGKLASTSPADEQCDGCPSAGECVPGVTCNGSTLVVCSDQATVTEQAECPLGCDDSQDHCKVPTPSNGLNPFANDAVSASPLVVSAGSTIDTDLGVIINGAGVPLVPPGVLLNAPAGGVAVRVLFGSTVILADVSVKGNAALAIISAADVLIEGRVDLSATQAQNGPGAVDTDESCKGKLGFGNGLDGFSSSGAGGGGFGTAGAKGGDVGTTFLGGDGGTSVGDETLRPLRGGCRGGGSGTQANGGAGGAIQIFSRTRIAIASGGYIDVSGAGGYRDLVTGSGGAGGGSGGAVLLEAPILEIGALGGITANGGGGGSFNEPGGADGALSFEPAAGGAAGGGKGGGGRGGARDAENPMPGEFVAFDEGSPNAAGGGGGGVGRIRINTLNAVFPSMPAIILSPEPSIGALATE
jgi:hypothetical protein